ncbi:MAG: 2-C-methyl-D-erythritol 4-phosphate cytidylyltransferase, partial [Pseudomonadota bacterium]
AGRGHRLGGDIPKQYLTLGDASVLRVTLAAFLSVQAITSIQVVIHPDDRRLYDAALDGLRDTRLAPPAMGGASRAMSVLAGLEALAAAPPSRVLIHDAARPFASQRVIADVLAALRTAPGAFAALPVVDALWRAEDGIAADPVPRAGLWRAQTPQGFHFDAILAAHRTGDPDAADDVAIARAAGLAVRVVPGAEENFKITTQDDLARARALMGR